MLDLLLLQMMIMMSFLSNNENISTRINWSNAGFEISNKISSKDKMSSLFIDTDVVVDFSCPVATESMLRYVIENNIVIPIVIGTTGLSEQCIEMMEYCSKYTQVFYSPNMSFLVSISPVPAIWNRSITTVPSLWRRPSGRSERHLVF